MWMWTDKDKLRKFVKSASKWIEHHIGQETALSPELVDLAFKRAQTNAYQVMSEFAFKTPETEGFLQGWVEVGLFAGFLSGAKNAEAVLAKAYPQDVIDALEPNTKALAIPTIRIAKRFASELTKSIFGKLLEPPRSPLIEGLDKNSLQLLQISFESSLYAGFLDAVDTAYHEGWVKGLPLGLDTVLVN